MSRKLTPEAKLAALRLALVPAAATLDPNLLAQINAILDGPAPKPKKLSRIDQWAEATGEAQDALAEAHDALETLKSLQEEYEEWRGNLPENLENSALAEKLDAVVDCELGLDDLEQAQSAVDDASGLDLPRGFGND